MQIYYNQYIYINYTKRVKMCSHLGRYCQIHLYKNIDHRFECFQTNAI